MKPIRTKPGMTLTLCVVLGLLILLTSKLEGATAFGSNPFVPNARSRARANSKRVASEPQLWLSELMSQWFKIPRPTSSVAAHGVKAKRSTSTAEENVRLIIQELRDSNEKLKAEVMALRAYMEQRGVTPEGGEVQGGLSGRLTVLSPSPPSPIPSDETAAQPTSKRPPPKVPREARMAALALLLSAAVVAGGVFVPIAIGEGAARVMRWLDGGGTLAPKSLRRYPAGYGGFSMLPTIRRRQKQWCLSYVPFLESGTIAPHRNDRLGSPGDALTGAWNELMPSR